MMLLDDSARKLETTNGKEMAGGVSRLVTRDLAGREGRGDPTKGQEAPKPHASSFEGASPVKKERVRRYRYYSAKF